MLSTKTRKEVEMIVEQVVEHQLFDTLAEEMELEGGEWSPSQGIELDRLVKKITALAIEYVEQNMEQVDDETRANGPKQGKAR